MHGKLQGSGGSYWNFGPLMFGIVSGCLVCHFKELEEGTDIDKKEKNKKERLILHEEQM